jgi:hypothetical protein
VIRRDQGQKRSMLTEHIHSITELNLMLLFRKLEDLQQQCMCKIPVPFLSKSLVRSAFHSDKYLTSYIRDALRNACKYSYRVFVIF